jgi:hypothetical protein
MASKPQNVITELYRNVLNIDSVAVVKVIKNGRSNSSLGSSLLKQIWRLLEEEWIVEISHTYPEANKCRCLGKHRMLS